MKKRYGCLALAFCLLTGSGFAVRAEEYTAGDGWKTWYADGKMESNFASSDVAASIGGLLPGDSVTIGVTLENQDKRGTDWYMTNEVLYSLEDRSANAATGGGAYTYRLTYTDKKGQETVLFSSDTIGGDNVSEAGEGLHAATDALEDYLYLDTLAKGDMGYVTLEVALDGETQGNDYQNTLADLQMNFAVEMAAASRTTRTDPEQPLHRDNAPTPQRQPARPTNVVRTGDELNLTPFITAACVSGVLLFVFAVYCRRESVKQKKGAQ